MSALRLLWVFTRIGIMNELEYRVNFFVQIFQSLLGLAAAGAQLAIIFAHTDTLAGWHASELIGLLGVYFMVGGIIRTIIQPSMQRFMEDVRQGTLDFTLTKPADAQMLVSLKQIEVWKLADVLLGLILMGVAVARMGEPVGLVQGLGFLVALTAGTTMVYSFWLVLATCTFWFVRLENIMVIFQSMYEAGRWPIGIYPGWLRGMLTFVIPVAFATTVPAEALSGRLTGTTLASAVALAALLLVVSRWFWTFGIRHYSGASA